jgi:hypothetical protein
VDQQNVNQVLWRQLNVLLEIQQNTSYRNALEHELAAFPDELQKLKPILSDKKPPRSPSG